MINSKTISTKEISKILDTKRNMVNYLFRKSDIPTIHRDNNGNKTLMEKESFYVVLEVVSKIIETHTDYENISNKIKNNLKFMFFTNILKDFKNISQTTKFTNMYYISTIDDAINVLVLIDGYFERFMIEDIGSNTKYEFGKLINDKSPINNNSYQPHTKSPHTVNGFWRKQQYGSRSNPIYKRIWIDTFERGVKKVG